MDQLKTVYGTQPTPNAEESTSNEGVHVDTGACSEETSAQAAASAHAASHGTGAPSVSAEVDAAVTAFAQASIADTPTATMPSAKSKRKPDVKAHSRRYDIVESRKQRPNAVVQSVPSNCTRVRGRPAASDETHALAVASIGRQAPAYPCTFHGHHGSRFACDFNATTFL